MGNNENVDIIRHSVPIDELLATWRKSEWQLSVKTSGFWRLTKDGIMRMYIEANLTYEGQGIAASDGHWDPPSEETWSKGENKPYPSISTIEEDQQTLE